MSNFLRALIGFEEYALADDQIPRDDHASKLRREQREAVNRIIQEREV